MNTLIIGGAGFIGAHLAGMLLASGRKVTVLGRHAQPVHTLAPGAVYMAGDFSNKTLLCDLLDRHQEVVHLAYATVPNTSFADPLQDLQQNLPSSVQLFAEIAARGGKLLLVSSGGTVYGEARRLPITEDHPTHPISPYGVSKLTLENYAYLYAQTHGLKYICVRPANAYGEGQLPFAGQGFVATAMAAALAGRNVQVYGANGVVRDYVHVTDMAQAMLAALEKGQLSVTYNIGSGQGLSNMQLLDKIRPLLQEQGIALQIEHLSERIFDVKANVLDASLLRRHTGWQPQLPLEAGLRHTLAWLGARHG